MHRRHSFDYRLDGKPGLLSIELAAALAAVALVVVLVTAACVLSDGVGLL
jgi:hypothetical protein